MFNFKNRFTADNFVFIRRAIFLFCIIMFCMAVSCIQIMMINMRHTQAVSDSATSKTLALGESRGIIYDTDLHRLVCNDYSYISAVKPTVKALSEIRGYIDDKAYETASLSVSKQMPFLIDTDCKIKSENLICEKIYKRYNDNQLASHIIGYTDTTGYSGLCGIELAYDRLLESYSGSLKARFFINGKGSVMLGGKVERINDNYNSSGGVVLTIDKKFQNALEKSMDEKQLKKGAAVILDIETGGVVAAVSRPDFNPNKISDYLDDTDSPLFNRAFAEYPVGSVFKPLVAASALEQGIDPKSEFNCNGKISNGNVEFRCLKNHGKVNMATALINSCNCYFVDLIEKIDCSKVIDLAASLGFGNEIMLDDKIGTSSGYLPDIEELDSFAAKANFSFGQGKLTATPIHIAALYSMIANGGFYRKSFLVKGYCDENGVFSSKSEIKPPVKCLSEDNSKILQDILELAVREGTGKTAGVQGVDVAGKTATAQSGEYIDGKERLVTWFAGFFPYVNPKYVAVIVCEDGVSGSKDCGPVFSSLVDYYTTFNYN